MSAMTDFILARLAQDEIDWQMVAELPTVQLLHGKPIAPRMLADIAARRKIVERAIYAIDNRDYGSADEYPSDQAEGVAQEYEGRILPLLAAPYRDDAEFRARWNIGDPS